MISSAMAVGTRCIASYFDNDEGCYCVAGMLLLRRRSLRGQLADIAELSLLLLLSRIGIGALSISALPLTNRLGDFLFWFVPFFIDFLFDFAGAFDTVSL